jgi:hypothetical protein
MTIAKVIKRIGMGKEKSGKLHFALKNDGKA